MDWHFSQDTCLKQMIRVKGNVFYQFSPQYSPPLKFIWVLFFPVKYFLHQLIWSINRKRLFVLRVQLRTVYPLIIFFIPLSYPRHPLSVGFCIEKWTSVLPFCKSFTLLGRSLSTLMYRNPRFYNLKFAWVYSILILFRREKNITISAR